MLGVAMCDFLGCSSLKSVSCVSGIRTRGRQTGASPRLVLGVDMEDGSVAGVDERAGDGQEIMAVLEFPKQTGLSFCGLVLPWIELWEGPNLLRRTEESLSPGGSILTGTSGVACLSSFFTQIQVETHVSPRKYPSSENVVERTQTRTNPMSHGDGPGANTTGPLTTRSSQSSSDE